VIEEEVEEEVESRFRISKEWWLVISPQNPSFMIESKQLLSSEDTESSSQIVFASPNAAISTSLNFD
jgi:hypothetical protein